MLKNVVCVFAVVLVFAVSVVPADAQSAEDLGDVLRSGLFGGLIGTMIGGAILLLISNAGDNLEVLGYGAGSGIILGTVYGLTQVHQNYFVELDQGTLSWNLPSVKIQNGPGKKPAIFLTKNTPSPTLKTTRVDLGFLKFSF